MEERIITQQQLADYQLYLQREERAPQTVQKYLHDLRTFMHWMEGRPVTKELVTVWKNVLSDHGKSSGTINCALAALHSFFEFCGWRDCRVKYLKKQRRLFRDSSRDLSKGEFSRLVAAAESQGNQRLALLLETICGTGIRVSEVKYITAEAIRQGMAEVSLKGKIRTILIPKKLRRKLQKYARNKKIISGEIFLTAGGKGLSRSQIWNEMKKLCMAAAVELSKVFPHNLRHLFARTFYQNSRDIVRLADVLGHSSVETTRIYLITTGDEYARALDQLGLVT